MERDHALQHDAGQVAGHAKTGVRQAGGFPMEFGTITVSDGISMGHEGMRASLVSREVICDSVETVVFAERLDGFVGLAGCDKSIPAMLMAAARLDVASAMIYNGSTMPGNHNGEATDITSVFEGVGACALGTITSEELDEIERTACPGEGACGGMFTANTMSSIGEALGMSMPGSASPPAIDDRRDDDARRAGEAVVNQLKAGITARTILTKKAFENAIALTSALGGSTNAVLHLLAIANEARWTSSWTTSTALPPRSPPRRHEAWWQVPHDRPRPGGGRADGHEDVARCRASPWRRADDHGQDRGREPGRGRPARP